MLLNKCLVQLFIILSCIYFDCPSVIPECDRDIVSDLKADWEMILIHVGRISCV